MLKQILKFIGWLLLTILLYVLVVLIHGTMTDYQPKAEIPLEADVNGNPESVISDSLLSFLIWNVGYGGLGSESDFFYDKGGMFFSGGRMIRPTESLAKKNIDGAAATLSAIDADFYLLQEVDYDSKRSYGINQFETHLSVLENVTGLFAPNYKAPRVPLPIFEPWRAYGKVYSGLATYSAYQPLESTRYQLPGSFSWPTRIFQLDRCAAVQKFPVSNGKELWVVNIHNSAYDKGGKLKKQQMDFLQDFLLDAYKKGHYIVVGGDWNQCPPFFPFDTFSPGNTQGYSQINIRDNFLPSDWTWAYDPTIPTNRKVGDIYEPGKTFETLIDFFLISPNLQAVEVKGIPQGFAYSDHQPVYLKVLLKNF
ncbi:MAG: endonuclease/exonuclease/phosphatase family protein [Bacteroidetes bacterium]|nr:endonuclease/exonuclease/phosphatase family protein [Bacteroidota bacterium]